MPVLAAFGGLLALGVGMRLLLGVFLRGTGDSLLAAGLLHAIYKACNNEGALVDGMLDRADQNLAAPIALVLVTGIAAAVLRRRLTRQYRRHELDGDTARPSGPAVSVTTPRPVQTVQAEHPGSVAPLGGASVTTPARPPAPRCRAGSRCVLNPVSRRRAC